MAILNTAHLSSKILKDGEEITLENNSNTHSANDVNTDILIEKSSQKNWVLPNNKVTIITKITNNTDEDIVNLNIKDTLGNDATFVDGTVEIGSQKYEEYNPITGFSLPATLGGSGGEMTMKYDVLVDKYAVEDSFSDVTDLNISLDSKQFSLQSNTINVTIVHNEISVLKTADAKAVKSGDILTYTITISNSGEYTNTNLFLTDPIPENTNFVENSVTVDGEQKDGYNPETGFALKDLAKDESTTVTFKVSIK